MMGFLSSIQYMQSLFFFSLVGCPYSQWEASAKDINSEIALNKILYVYIEMQFAHSNKDL